MSTVADLPPSAEIQTKPGSAIRGNLKDGVLEENVAWRCLWQESSAFFQAMVGTTETIPLGNGVSIQRRVPLRNPYNPNLFATDFDYEAIDGAKKGNNLFQDVIFRVKFSNKLGGSTNGFEGGNQTPNNKVPLFCRITSQATTRSVTDTARQYTYGNNIKLKHDVAVQFGGNAYSVTLYMIPDIDEWQGVVAPLVGKVNSTPFNLGAFTRDPGTVLMEGYGYDVDYDVLGNQYWTGTISLHCSSLPWNKYLVGGQQVSLSPQPYTATDLNVLYM